MKKLLPIITVTGLIAFAAIVLISVYYLSSRYLLAPSNSSRPTIADCKVQRQNHKAVILNNSISPALTRASLCDTLTIINNDETVRLIAFGPHDDHQPYDGVAEKELSKGQSFTITLNQIGTFHFHDHIEDVAQADFTVTK